MSSVYNPRAQEWITGLNVTTRRVTAKGKKMALNSYKAWTSDTLDSLLVESILSQDEAKDVITMLEMADELEGVQMLPGFFTSTQMGYRVPRSRLSSPPLSPVPFPSDQGGPDTYPKTTARTEGLEKRNSEKQHRQDSKVSYQKLLSDGNIYSLLGDEWEESLRLHCGGTISASQNGLDSADLIDPVTSKVDDLLGEVQLTY